MYSVYLIIQPHNSLIPQFLNLSFTNPFKSAIRNLQSAIVLIPQFLDLLSPNFFVGLLNRIADYVDFQGLLQVGKGPQFQA